MKKLFNENRLEFMAFFTGLVGLVFIGLRGRAEPLLKQGYALLTIGLEALYQSLRTDFPRYIKAIPLSILVGWLLVLLAVSVVIYRVRHRFSTSEGWLAIDCPRCGSGLQRYRRNPIDRLLSHTLLPSARRYRCENSDCHWSGLRRKCQHQDRSPSPLQTANRIHQ